MKAAADNTQALHKGQKGKEKDSKILINEEIQAWRDGSAVKSASCFCRGPEFVCSPYISYVTTTYQGGLSAGGLHRYCTHVHTSTQTHNYK